MTYIYGSLSIYRYTKRLSEMNYDFVDRHELFYSAIQSIFPLMTRGIVAVAKLELSICERCTFYVEC